MTSDQRNKQNLRSIINSVGFTFGVLMLVNIIGFITAYLFTGLSDDYSLLFKHGTFYINGNATGLEWGDHVTSTLIIVLFVIAIIYHYRKGKLTFK